MVGGGGTWPSDVSVESARGCFWSGQVAIVLCLVALTVLSDDTLLSLVDLILFFFSAAARRLLRDPKTLHSRYWPE